MVKRIVMIMLSVLTCLSGGCKTTPQMMDTHVNGDLNAPMGLERIWMGDTYYSAEFVDGQSVILANREGKKETFIHTTEQASCFNLVDQQTMMYIDGDKICSCDLITGDVTEVAVANNPTNLQVREGIAFYLESVGLFMLDINTGNRQKIAEFVAIMPGFSVYDGKIFYQTTLREDGEFRHVIMEKNIYNLSEERAIFEGPASYIVAREDGVYFLNHNHHAIPYVEGDDVLCRINPDGSVVRLGEQKVYTYNIRGDWIYYANDSDGRKLYQMKTDGTENKKISEKRVWLIVVYGNELELVSVEENVGPAIYKMDLSNFKTELIDTFQR